MLEIDAMPFKLVPLLQKHFQEINFVHHDPSENLPIQKHSQFKNNYDLIIIDTVLDIDKVICITDEKQLAIDSVYSPHDWDLALNLKLLLKLGQLKTFLIVGVPSEGDLETIFNDISIVIQKEITT